MNKSVNIELAKTKGLIVNDDNSEYVLLENLYKYLFENFLNEQVNLKKYDEELLNSELDFGISHPRQEQKGNNLNDFFKYNYIFLLNNFFIEKLSVEDINILRNSLKLEKLVPTKELIDIIKRTYIDVIKNNYTKKGYVDEIYIVSYGEFHPGNFVSNNALALKIFYGKNKKQMTDEEYLKNMKDKKDYLNNLVERMKNEIKEKLDINIEILTEKIPN